jgi:hypothetical protein
MSELWWNARAMEHSGTVKDPFHQRSRCRCVYNIVERVVKDKHLPNAFSDGSRTFELEHKLDKDKQEIVMNKKSSRDRA